jgi:putative CocE/NonD family hydrolase
VTNNKWLDNEDYNSPHWSALTQDWFDKGLSYRSLDSLLGRGRNGIFQAWLNHPTYDAYWRSMIPYKEEFSRIDIPVLTTTGYYDGGQIGALYYMREHMKYSPGANHYLLIGPYGHFGSQGYPDTVYNGYPIDEAATVPIHQIIYQWFDYILKGKQKPAILQDKVTYEVMGANVWKRAGSLQAVSSDHITFYLDQQQAPLLETSKPKDLRYTKIEVDFSDRSTQHHYYYNFQTIWDSIFDGGGAMYVSRPLEKEVDLAGCFSGEMQVIINKKDMDYSLVLFEQLPDGRCFYLTYFMGRASYARTNTDRKLLTPGKKSSLPFDNSYFVSKRLQKGSRLVLLVNANKTPREQINYGTGKDVSTETIFDAREPLRIQLLNTSFIRLPISK